MVSLSNKRQIAAAALRQIADAIEAAPMVTFPGAPYSADQMLEAMFSPDEDGNLFADKTWASDAPDETHKLDWCMICDSERHDANCPVGMLEALVKIGVSGPKPVPHTLGLRGYVLS